MMTRKRVLITGVYGLIGNAVYARLMASGDAYDVYGLARRAQPSSRLPAGDLHHVPADKLIVANLTDAEAVRKAAQGMDVVVHMAANPNGDASWESVLENNIVGGYNVFEACRLGGVRRLVYASTVQVIWGYRLDEPHKTLFNGDYSHFSPADYKAVFTTDPTRPLNFYAASKVWGEAMAHVYAYTYGLSCLCVRIGWVQASEPPSELEARGTWCSRRDLTQLLELCINAPESLRFDVFFGLSQNKYNVADIQHTRDVLGYAPLDGIQVS
jgi:nucleoside-diphosphate-sugar epimerase